MRKTTLALLAVLALSIQSAHCESNVKMTASQLTALIKSADSRVTASGLTVIGTGPSVTILAEKSASASDRDLKIDAIFLAKALIEGSAGQVDRVKALFSQPDKPGRFVLVDKKVVQDYAEGKLTPEQLLGSVTLTALEAERAPDVAQGPLLERRLLVWRRIEKLRQQGTGVATFQKLFQQVEKSAQSTENPEALVQDVAFLELKLTEQEGLVKQARKYQEGRGIKHPNNNTSASSASSSTSPSSNVTSLAHPQNQQQHTEQKKPTNIPWGQGGNNQQQPPPPPPYPPGGPPGGGGPPP